MSRDFLSSRLRTQSIIGSNSPDDPSKPKLVIYPESYATNHTGGIDEQITTDLGNIGNHSATSFIYIQGSPYTGSEVGPTSPAGQEATVFVEGNSVIKGTLWVSTIRDLTGNILSSSEVSITDNTTTIDILEGLDFEDFAEITDEGSNTASFVGVIGKAETGDASYEDGLFSDFTSKTPVGTAIDRFNEVLKALAPQPAPSLDQIDVNTAPSTLSNIRLSFGVSNDQSGAVIPYANVENTAGFTLPADAIDINQEFTKETRDNNYRLGVYDGSQDFIGDLNEDITQDAHASGVVNYPDNSFGNGDKGRLQLFLNGLKVQEIDLSDPANGAGDYLTVNTGFINISAPISSQFASGQVFDTFKYRTGQWKVAAADQRNGWNYVQVKHVIGDTESVTGFAEWVNDRDNSLITITPPSFTLAMAGSKYLSGIEYHTSGNATYSSTISNFYKYVYKTGNIEFTSSDDLILLPDDVAIPDIVTDHTDDINLSQTKPLLLDNNRLLNESVTLGFELTHPLKASILLADTNQIVSGILVDASPVSSTDTSTDFDDEADRIQVSSPYTQAGVAAGLFLWNSEENIVTGDVGHNTGLMVYNSKLVSPKSADLPNSGDFSLLNSGPVNPNYSTIPNANRVFIKKIKNTTGGDIDSLLLTITGSGSTILDSDTLDSSQINVQFKLPSSDTVQETEWMSIASDFDIESHFQGLGLNESCGDTTVNGVDFSINGVKSDLFVTFGNDLVKDNEHVLLKITAPGNWAGQIESLSVNMAGVIDEDSIDVIPSLTEINPIESGVTGRLSFGTTNTVATFTNVAGSDINALFQNSGNKIGIFDSNTDITGKLNDNVVSTGNSYPDDAFGDGVSGTLRLEVNGLPIHEVDLSDIPFESGDSLNFNLSGFTDLTSPNPTRDSNNRPSFADLWRKSGFKITAANQRNGYNFAEVKHIVDVDTTHVTNRIEWVVDDNTAAPNFTNDGEGPTRLFREADIVSTQTNSLSGISYFKNVTSVPYEIIINNLYRNVYSNLSDAISVYDKENKILVKEINLTGVNNNLISNLGLPVLAGDSNVGNRFLPGLLGPGDESERLKVESIVEVNYTKSILDLDNLDNFAGMNTVEIYLKAKHPLTSPDGIETSGADEVITSNKFLQYEVDTTIQSDVVETFINETKRVLDDVVLDTQDNVSDSPWDSSLALVNGLMVYDSKLRYPKGNFIGIVDDVTKSIYAPTGNPNYSLQTGNKVYIRKFKNNSGSTQVGFSLLLQGDNSILSESLSETNIKVYVKLPKSDLGTGFMNVIKSFNGSYNDDDGALIGAASSSITVGQITTNNITFGQKFVLPNEHIILKIEANENWAGYINNIEVNWS